MTAPTDPALRHRPTYTEEHAEVDHGTSRAAEGLRIFQVLAAVAGGVLFVFGLVAVFRVDFGADLLDTSAAVAGFGFSAVAAIAAIVLGGATLAATLADQDRGSTSFIGLLTIATGIAGLVVEGQIPEEVQVDQRAAGLFIGLGAATFVLGLIPWFGRRRTQATVVRRSV